MAIEIEECYEEEGDGGDPYMRKLQRAEGMMAERRDKDFRSSDKSISPHVSSMKEKRDFGMRENKNS